MTIDRTIGWARRGHEHPSPWGESLPDSWSDTTFHFYSRITDPSLNPLGGFSGSTKVEYAQLQGRYELRSETGVSSGEASTPLVTPVSLRSS